MLHPFSIVLNVDSLCSSCESLCQYLWHFILSLLDFIFGEENFMFGKECFILYRFLSKLKTFIFSGFPCPYGEFEAQDYFWHFYSLQEVISLKFYSCPQLFLCCPMSSSFMKSFNGMLSVVLFKYVDNSEVELGAKFLVQANIFKNYKTSNQNLQPKIYP